METTPEQLRWVVEHNMQIRAGHRAQILACADAWDAALAGRDMWHAQVTNIAHVHKAVDMLTDQRNAARAELNAALHDIEAYRGALGYDVAGSHDGRLSNGTTPRCGLCDAASQEARKCKDVGVSISGQSGHGAYLQSTTDVLATGGSAEGVEQSKREADALVVNQPAPLDAPDAPVNPDCTIRGVK